MRSIASQLSKSSSRAFVDAQRRTFLNVAPRRSFLHTGAAAANAAASGALREKLSASGVSVGRLNHVAIAVPNLDESIALYRDVLGAKVSEKQDLSDHGVTVVFVELSNTKIELLHPFGDKSPIQNFLDSKKIGGIHHICLEVDDVHSAHKQLTDKGLRILDKAPKIGAHGVPVFFIHPKEFNGVLVELEQAQ